MVSSKSKAAIEFLHFLADISDPNTGDISALKLAAWLGMTEEALLKRWMQRGPHSGWRSFADEVIGVLDAAQSQGASLDCAIDWYRNTPIAQCGLRTPDQIVVAGEAPWLVRQLDVWNVWVRPGATPRLHDRR
ncbi:MAG TPA: hypothetical protein VME63_09305 [Dyella sp.]|uniref:hypothetical protein n=1 Tax=Dyella sp. TaxID=1869338 RepID=UPI002C194BF7|nr:hypothetical protein [Dyella sp.]HTV85593.1 hypothetical protein [Dyella sp.]